MSILNTKNVYMQLYDAAFLFISTIVDAILNFDFFFSNNSMLPECHDAVFELEWSDEPKEDGKDNKRSELFASHTCTYSYYVDFCNIFRHLLAILLAL